MHHFCIGDADLDFHFMQYIMEICGLDYKNTEKVFNFQSKYQKLISNVFNSIEDRVKSFPIENYYTDDVRHEAWYNMWNPQGTTFINSFEDGTIIKYGVPDLNEGYYIFDNIVEAYILKEICFNLAMSYPDTVTVQCSLDLLKQRITDDEFMDIIDDKLKAVVKSIKSVKAMDIATSNVRHKSMRKLMKLCGVIEVDPSHVYDFEEQYGDAIYRILEEEGFAVSDVLPTYVIGKIKQIINRRCY